MPPTSSTETTVETAGAALRFPEVPTIHASHPNTSARSTVSGNGSLRPHSERVLPRLRPGLRPGRCALEAISCGAAVVLVDAEGLGPMVTSANVDALHLDGMGRRALSSPHGVDLIGEQIDRFDAADAAAVVDHVRTKASLAAMTDALVTIYDEARQLGVDLEVHPADDLEWLLDFLPVLSRLGHERDAVLLTRHQLGLHRDMVLVRLEQTEAVLERSRRDDQAEIERMRAEVTAIGTGLDALRSTRWFRSRARILGVPGLRRVVSRRS